MKALTICQPYAELILCGKKRVENRMKPTRHRGPLLIHAGKSRDWLQIVPQPPTYEGCPDMSYDRPSGLYLADMDFGAIAGRVTLIDCLPIDEIASGAADERYPWIRAHEHSNGPWCWVLGDDVGRFAKPIPYRGQLGLFGVPDAVLAQQEAA